MRNKLYDKLQEFVMEADKEALIAKLQETEDWLYEDGEDETKGVYVAKLDELKKQGDPIEQRYKEHTERGSFVDHLVNLTNAYRQAAASGDPKYDHIDISEMQKVLNECSEVENWLREKKQQQDSLPKHADPVLLVSDIRKKAEAVDRVCRPFQATNGEKAKVKVKARLNLHGIVSIESVQLIEEDVEGPLTKEATKMDTNQAPADVAPTNEIDVNMQDVSVAENGAPETRDSHLKSVDDWNSTSGSQSEPLSSRSKSVDESRSQSESSVDSAVRTESRNQKKDIVVIKYY